jgi:hypothetical protein
VSTTFPKILPVKTDFPRVSPRRLNAMNPGRKVKPLTREPKPAQDAVKEKSAA